MSLAGFNQFERNVRTLLRSEQFKKADVYGRLRLADSLLRSKYGAFVGGPKPLPWGNGK